MEVPIRLMTVLKPDDADIVWKDYRKGKTVWENACTSDGFGHGWISDGSRADDGTTPLRFLELDRFKSY
jgi:hypothetical protein